MEGLSNYQAENFEGLEELSMSQRKDLYIKKVKKIVQSSILGSNGNEAQWVLSVCKVSNGEEKIAKKRHI